MNFLNLSFGEFAALAGVISAGLVALYLFDRTRRRRVVATLRFWTPSEASTQWKRSRKVQQPWSLLLQILSMLLLLLAIAGPRFGGTLAPRDHVLILDTSAWMGARTRQGILLDQAKSTALSYLDRLPSNDAVMLVRADALTTPVTAFESRHQVVAEAIRQSHPSASALNLQQALDFASNAQHLQAGRAGEIVFAGAARVSKEESDSLAPPANFRLLQIASNGENVGWTKLGVRRSLKSPDSWDAYAALKNDGARPRDVSIELFSELRSGKTTLATKTMTIAPGAEASATFTFKLPEAGLLQARVRTADNREDAFPQDDRVALDLPAQTTSHIVVYSNDPESLRPLFAGHPQFEAQFKPTSRYDAAASVNSAAADIVVLDRFVPARLPVDKNILWIDPPAGSPFAIRAQTAAQRAPEGPARGNGKIDRWRAESPLAAGLNTKDLELTSAKIFELSKNDQAVAETSSGPVVVSRVVAGTSPSKMVAIGFEPTGPSMKYQLATPLLIANILRWMAPDTFRTWDMQAATVGAIRVPLAKAVDPAKLRVTGERDRPLPFTLQDDPQNDAQGATLRFFSGAPGTVHVRDGDHDSIYSLTLPDVGETTWKAPSSVARGLPRFGAQTASVANLWPCLAVLGGLGLLLEWILFGRGTTINATAAAARWSDKIPWRKAS
jgi:hypothetical protein